MDIKEIREYFGRIKVYYLKNDSVRALGAAVMAMKGVVAMPAPSVEIKGMIREGIQTLSRDEQIKAFLKTPLTYTPGQEKQLFAQLASIYKQVLAVQDHEEHDTAFGRKQKIDQAFNLGVKLLEQNQVSEADASFAEAVTYYKDEHTLWRHIAKALMTKGELKRAMPYLRKCIDIMPTDAETLQLYEQARIMRAENA